MVKVEKMEKASERHSRAENGAGGGGKHEEISPRGRLPCSLQSRAWSCMSLAPVSQLLREKKGTACSLRARPRIWNRTRTWDIRDSNPALRPLDHDAASRLHACFVFVWPYLIPHPYACAHQDGQASANDLLSLMEADPAFESLFSFFGEGMQLPVRPLVIPLSPSSALPRVINVKFPLQPHQKYHITQYEELGFP